MIGTVRALIAGTLLAAPLVLTACNLEAVEVVIPDFESAEVLGVNVYQRVAHTGDPDTDWERASRIVFTEPYMEDGTEVMEYTVEGQTAEGEPCSETFRAVVSRESEGADEVSIHIFFRYDEAEGPVRVTTFNAAGESPPSENTKAV